MPGPIPEWDLADRMRKSLRHSGVGVQEMADYLGVARNTVYLSCRDLRAVQELCGHRSPAVTALYVQARSDVAIEAVTAASRLAA